MKNLLIVFMILFGCGLVSCGNSTSEKNTTVEDTTMDSVSLQVDTTTEVSE